VGCWRGYLSGVRCRLVCGPADATATQSLASVKSRLVLPFWYRLTWIVPFMMLIRQGISKPDFSNNNCRVRGLGAGGAVDRGGWGGWWGIFWYRPTQVVLDQRPLRLCVFSNNVRSTSQKYNKRAIKRVCVCEQNMLIQLSTGIYLFL